MAKKRNGRINIELSKPDNTGVVELSENGLPSYHHFVDAPDHSFRLFFDDPKSDSETHDSERLNKKFLRVPNGNNPFRIMSEGKGLVGEDIAKTFATLLIKLVLNHKITNIKSPCVREIYSIKLFFNYLSGLHKPITQYSEIKITHLSDWLSKSSLGNFEYLKYGMKRLLNMNPGNRLDLTKIQKPKQIANSKRLEKIDFDEITKSKDYSGKVLFQFLAYTFYDIEHAMDRLNTFKNASPSVLGDKFIKPGELNSKNPLIKYLLDSGEKGYKILIYHLFFYLNHPSKNNFVRLNSKAAYPAANFLKRIKELSLIIYKHSPNPDEKFNKFITYLNLSQPDNWPLLKNGHANYYTYMNLGSWHHEVAIYLFSLMSLGVNKEVALSWKHKVNNKPWYENYDVELGISDASAKRDKKVVLVGLKKKGRKPTEIKKSISINSPLFKYLKFLDQTRSTNREYIFEFSMECAYMKAFVNHYPIIGDDGKRLKSIQTQRFRKSYLGYKTFSLLEGVKSSEDLVLKLKESLNHKSFDTTFSSYMMTSGMTRTVVNSAIVALTTNMIEKAVSFKGEIKQDNERSINNEAVYLCDCSDPSNPTHELAINDKCYKYDMCLGCERSEVFSEHLPAICYRIMQYEKKQEEDPDVFKATFEDRMIIAKDTVEQFTMKHSNGMTVVEQAYLIANQAMLDNDPLLPDILQTGAL